MAANAASVLTNFLINLYIFLGCFGAFSILRLRPWARRFFAARRYAKDIDLKPAKLPSGYLSWIWPVITYPEADIIDEAGLDCAMYLRILRFGVYLFFPLTIVCVIIVLPSNMTSNGIDVILAQQEADNSTSTSNDLKFSNFDVYSLVNVESGSKKMWAHLVTTYIVVLYTLWLLWRFNKESVLLRLLFLGNAKRGGPSHTVLVTDIPGVKEAVSKGLAAEKAKEQEAKRLEADKSQPRTPRGEQADEGGSPVPPAASRRQSSIRKGKVVSITEPPQLQASAPASPRAGAAAQPAGKNAGDAKGTLPDVKLGNGGDGGKVADDSDWDDRDFEAANSGLSKTGGSRFSRFINIIAGSDSDAKYRLVDDDVDPKYRATGGKLELARTGWTNQKILDELQVVEKEDLLQGLPENLGVDTRPLPPTRRTTKRYQYDLKSKELDVAEKSEIQLKNGVTPQYLVAREFAMVYGPSIVAAVNMIPDTSNLEPLTTEFNQIVQDLDDYLEMAKLRLKLRKGLPQKQIRILGMKYQDMEYVKKFNTKWFIKVDAVEWWLERLRVLREKIKVEQTKCIRKAAPSAFVTFNTRMAQAVAANSLLSHDETMWRVTNAPAPFELQWGNLSLTFAIRNGRMYILWAVFVVMTLFFMVPVTAIQAMIEVPRLASVPVLGDIVTTPPIKQLLQAVIPGLVLKIFIAIVPIILRIMAQLSGTTSISEIDFGVVKRYFVFQVVVVFLGSIIAGSFFNQLTQWVKDPGSVITTLGKSIPMTSTFFITYLLVNGLGVKSLAFIRLPNFVIFWILSKFAGSPRARQRIWMYQYTNNGTTVVDHTIAILLGLVFSCINPIVCPAALAYMLVNFLGESYNNIYVYRREYESAGRLWKTVYNQVMTALYIMQLTMLGLLSLKKFKYSFFIIVLLVISIACHISTLQLYSRPWSVTALHDAAYMDMLEADQRRMVLLAASREERKKKRDKIKRAYDDAVRKAENNDEPPPPYDKRLDYVPPPGYTGAGKAEQLLLESLEGDGFALNSEEKREIEEMYLNPAFKVKLDEVDRLTKLANEVQERLPRLNEWVAKYHQYRREVKRRRILGDTEQVPPPKMPEDLTIFDGEEGLLDSDSEGGSDGTGEPDLEKASVSTELNPLGNTNPDAEADAAPTPAPATPAPAPASVPAPSPAPEPAPAPAPAPAPKPQSKASTPQQKPSTPQSKTSTPLPKTPTPTKSSVPSLPPLVTSKSASPRVEV